jgi:hypothetical protein
MFVIAIVLVMGACGSTKPDRASPGVIVEGVHTAHQTALAHGAKHNASENGASLSEQKPILVHRGGHVVAHGVTPDGHSFLIATEVTELRHRLYHGLRLSVDKPSPIVMRAPILRLASPVRDLKVRSPSELVRLASLEWELARACPPSRYAIIYGILRSTDDTVLVKAASGVHVLDRTTGGLGRHAHGVVVYGVETGPLYELLVRSPAGAVVIDEDLRATPVRGPCL